MHDTTHKQWQTLHGQSRFLPKYPAEVVVRFTFAHVTAPTGAYTPVVLDLGCGGGRHMVFLACEGYRTVGVDFSQPALDAAREMLRKEGVTADLRLANAKNIPFSDGVFDAAIAYGSLYYLKWADMRQAVKEVYRVLKPGGSCLIFTRADMDYRCGKGIKLDERSYLLNTPETNEAGMVNCFLRADDIPPLLEDFGAFTLERYEFTEGNGSVLNSDWAITAAKSR
jgi:SAM-dependent methyltransferase